MEAINITQYDELLADAPTVADAMGEVILGGEKRMEMARLIQLIEKTPGTCSDLKLRLASLLVDATTDEVLRISEEG